MGIEFELDFYGINGELKQYEIFSSNTDPLNNAALLQFGATISQPYGSTLSWPSIPGELFFTYEETP